MMSVTSPPPAATASSPSSAHHHHARREHSEDGNRVWVSVHKRPSLYVSIALRMMKTHDTVELRGLGAGQSRHAPLSPPSLSPPPSPDHSPLCCAVLSACAALAATIEVAEQLLHLRRGVLQRIHTSTSAGKPELSVVLQRTAAAAEHNEDDEALIQLTEDTQMNTE